MKKIIILLAHGSPEKYARGIIISLKGKLSQYFPKNKFELYHAFLEFNKPRLEECFKQVFKNKRTRTAPVSVVILPVFISKGSHIMFQVPKIIKSIKKKYKNIDVKLALPLGADDLVVKILYTRYKQIVRK